MLIIIGIILIIVGILVGLSTYSLALILGIYIFLPLGFILLLYSIVSFKPYQIFITGVVAIVVGVVIYWLNQDTSLESSKAILPLFFIVFVIPSGGILILIAIIKAIYFRYKKQGNFVK